VFEAFIASRDFEPEQLGFEDDFIEAERGRASHRQSKKVLRELKVVLVGKQKEWEVREARAIARQAGVDLADDEDAWPSGGADSSKWEAAWPTGAEAVAVQSGSPEEVAENGVSRVNGSGHLEVPRSMVRSNILGLSQETNSDAESVRSDTDTVRPGSGGLRHGSIASSRRSSSGEEGSHCSDSEVGGGIKDDG
jgi:hypothetical protein